MFVTPSSSAPQVGQAVRALREGGPAAAGPAEQGGPKQRAGHGHRAGLILLLLLRSGKLCARYVRADLPLLDLQSRAGLNSVLGLGIALASFSSCFSGRASCARGT